MKVFEKIYKLSEKKRRMLALFFTFLISIPIVLIYLKGLKESFSKLKKEKVLYPVEKIKKEFENAKIKEEVEKVIQKNLEKLPPLEGQIKNEEKGE
jgi:1-acyl-sn-glycerol-3-phosphate acyltransferase